MPRASKAWWLSLAGFLAGLLCALPATAAAGQSIHLENAEISAPLPGSFDVPEAQVDAASLPTEWHTQALPHVMPRNLAPSDSDIKRIFTTWYRLRLDGLEISTETSYLYLPRWQSIGKIAIYADGRLIYRSRSGPVWNGWNHPIWIPLAEPASAPPQEVLIRFDTLAGAGGALSTVWVGDQSELDWRRKIREGLQNHLPEICSGVFVVLGLFSFFVWVGRRHETIYLLFSLSAVLSSARYLHYYLGQDPLPIPEDWFSWITVTSAGWLVITVYFFAFRLHGRRYPRLEKTLVVLMAVATAITMPAMSLVPNLSALTPLAYLIVFGELIVVTAAMAFASYRSRSKEGLLFSAWHSLNIPFTSYDWMLQNYKVDIEGIYLMPFSVIGTMSFFMIMLLRRYVRAINDVEHANQRLETTLAQREQELAASYTKLREIERQQLLGDERRRLMRDMHDGLGFSLTSALAVAQQGGPESGELAHVLRECIDDLKLTIDSLEPSEADLPLLLAALRHRLDPRLQAAGITLHWAIEDLPRLPWLTPSSVLQILRILQESFSNAIRHSQATHIRLHAVSDEQAVSIHIEDNGRGFDVEAMLARTSGGRGLRNLLQRARQLSADIRVESAAGRTLIVLHLPRAALAQT